MIPSGIQDCTNLLDTLLSVSVDEARVREANELRRSLAGRTDIVLFGSGNLGRKLLPILQQHGLNVVAFADSSEQKWETFVEGVPVISPSAAAAKFGKTAGFVVTIWAPAHSFRSTRSRLEQLGCDIVLPFALVFWAYPEALPHYQFEQPSKLLAQADSIRKAYAFFAHDVVSVRHYLGHLAWRLTMNYDALPDVSPSDQYVVDNLIPAHDDIVFIDGGAFDGDTVRRILDSRFNNFRCYLAFEPDPCNFKRLHDFWLSLPEALQQRIELRQEALFSREGVVRFDAAAATRAMISAEGGVEVAAATIDGLVSVGQHSFIKLDLEGAELDALKGGESSIAKDSPDLAVCVYHHPADLWSLPLWIAQTNASYRFYLRSHDEDGLETVCYATARQS